MLLFVIFAVFLGNVHAYKVYDCGSVATIHYVSIEGCTNSNDQKNCIVQRGSWAKLTMSFTPRSTARSVCTKVTLTTSWWWLPMPIKEVNSCFDHVDCPLKTGEANTYSVNHYIKEDCYRGSGTINWKLTDQDGNGIVCVDIPGKLI